MANPPKARGTAAESAVVKFAAAMGIPARRVALAGRADQGDVHLWDGRVVIEVKSRRAGWTWTQIDAWYREADAEANRVEGADVTVLVVKRPGTGARFAGDWFAWVSVSDLMWWHVQQQPASVGAVAANLAPAQRVMLPLGDLLALLKAGVR